MALKLLVFIFAALGFSNSSFAEDVCVANGKELKAQKEHFPKFFQTKNEVKFARSAMPTAHMKIEITDEKISGEAKYIHPLWGIKLDTGYAKSLCYNSDTHEMKVTLESGKEFTVTIVNDNPPEATVKIKGFELTRKSDEYSKAVEKIAAKEGAAAPSFGTSNRGEGAQ